MNHQIEAYCKGAFRSYKIFRSSGEVVQHSEQNFLEWNFGEDRLLTISEHRQQRRTVVVKTNKWALVFNNRRYYIQIEQSQLQTELITVNHTGLVIEDGQRGEKIFFARLPAWEDFVQNKRLVL